MDNAKIDISLNLEELQAQAKAAKTVTEGFAAELKRSLEESLREANTKLAELNKRRDDFLKGGKKVSQALSDPAYVNIMAERRAVQKQQRYYSDELQGFEGKQIKRQAAEEAKKLKAEDKAEKTREKAEARAAKENERQEKQRQKHRERQEAKRQKEEKQRHAEIERRQKAADRAKARAEQREQGRETQTLAHRLQRNAMLLHMGSRGLGALPGGGIALAGISGFTSGYAESRFEVDPKTGRRRPRRGVGGQAAALGGGLAQAGMMAGFGALAAAIYAAVSGSRRDEGLYLSGGRAAGGSRALGRAGVGLAYGASGLTTEEAMGAVSAGFRNAGTLGAARASVKAEQAAGLGGQFAGLLGGMARAGSNTDANAMRTLQEVFAAGTAQGLERGRFHELIAGATAIANDRVLGTIMGPNGMSSVLGLSALLGQTSGAFKGQRGMDMVGALDKAVRGQGSPFTKSLALMAAGLGEGSSYVQASMAAEGGITGPGGLDRLRKMISKSNQVFGPGGGDNKILATSRAFGIPLSAANELLKMDPSKITEKSVKSIMDKHKSEAEKSYDAMTGTWKSIDKKLQEMASKLGKLFEAIGGPGGLNSLLGTTNELLSFVIDILPGGGLDKMRKEAKDKEAEKTGRMNAKAPPGTRWDPGRDMYVPLRGHEKAPLHGVDPRTVAAEEEKARRDEQKSREEAAKLFGAPKKLIPPPVTFNGQRVPEGWSKVTIDGVVVLKDKDGNIRGQVDLQNTRQRRASAPPVHGGRR